MQVQAPLAGKGQALLGGGLHQAFCVVLHFLHLDTSSPSPKRPRREPQAGGEAPGGGSPLANDLTQCESTCPLVLIIRFLVGSK